MNVKLNIHSPFSTDFYTNLSTVFSLSSFQQLTEVTTEAVEKGNDLSHTAHVQQHSFFPFSFYIHRVREHAQTVFINVLSSPVYDSRLQSQILHYSRKLYRDSFSQICSKYSGVPQSVLLAGNMDSYFCSMIISFL